MKVTKTYQKNCALCLDVYIICICNVLILSDYCVTIKNELLATFASLGSEVARLIEPNLIPQTCSTDGSDMSDGLRLDNLS
jgi:hypothetical protein